MTHDHIWLAAKEFLDAFYVLSENNRRVRAEIAKSNPCSISPDAMRRLKSGELKQTSIPDVMCLAFAIELYLKSLILKLSAIPATGHSLVKLYEHLPASAQSSIFSRTAQTFGGLLTEATFAENLASIDKAFVEWRYMFEKGRADFKPSFAHGLALAVRDEVQA